MNQNACWENSLGLGDRLAVAIYHECFQVNAVPLNSTVLELEFIKEEPADVFVLGTIACSVRATPIIVMEDFRDR